MGPVGFKATSHIHTLQELWQPKRVYQNAELIQLYYRGTGHNQRVSSTKRYGTQTSVDLLVVLIIQHV